MESQTPKALALRPTRNSQGGHNIHKIRTGHVITRFMWTTLPLPTCIRKLVQRLARQSTVALEVLDRLRLELPDAKPDNDEAD